LTAPGARAASRSYASAPPPVPRSPSRAARCTLAARTLRYRAKFAALVLIIVAAALCIALLALFGILWAALHFGAGEDEDEDD
jgi:hypothetical protein